MLLKRQPTKDGDNIGEQVALAELVRSSEMSEAWRTEFTAVGDVGSVGDHVNPEFAFGSLNCSVRGSRWYLYTRKITLNNTCFEEI